jgi:endonuclease III
VLFEHGDPIKTSKRLEENASPERIFDEMIRKQGFSRHKANNVRSKAIPLIEQPSNLTF